MERVFAAGFGRRKAELRRHRKLLLNTHLVCVVQRRHIVSPSEPKPPELREIERLPSAGVTRFGSVSPDGVKRLAKTPLG